MAYSNLLGLLLLSAALSACAHGTGSRSASTTSAAPTTVVTAGQRSTDGPRFARQQTMFLAEEAHPHVTGGQVVGHDWSCSVWSQMPDERCNVIELVNRSITPGYQN